MQVADQPFRATISRESCVFTCVSANQCEVVMHFGLDQKSIEGLYTRLSLASVASACIGALQKTVSADSLTPAIRSRIGPMRKNCNARYTPTNTPDQSPKIQESTDCTRGAMDSLQECIEYTEASSSPWNNTFRRQ